MHHRSLSATRTIASFWSEFSISCLKISKFLSFFWGCPWAKGIWLISSSSIFAPIIVLSTHSSEEISFHLLRQDAMFTACNFLFDVLLDSWIFLPVCHSVLAFLLWFVIVILVFRLVPLALLFSLILMVWVRLTLHVLRSSSWCRLASAQKRRLDFILWRFMRGNWYGTTKSNWLLWNCKPRLVSFRYIFNLLWWIIPKE